MNMTTKHYVLIALGVLSAVATALHNQIGGEGAVIAGVASLVILQITSLLTQSPVPPAP